MIGNYENEQREKPENEIVSQDIPYCVSGTVFFILHGIIVFHIGGGLVNVSSMAASE